MFFLVSIFHALGVGRVLDDSMIWEVVRHIRGYTIGLPRVSRDKFDLIWMSLSVLKGRQQCTRSRYVTMISASLEIVILANICKMQIFFRADFEVSWLCFILHEG